MKGKILILLVFILGLSWQTIFGQTEPQIKQIRAEVGKINNSLSKYKKISKIIEDISTEGAKITSYSSKAGIRKVHAEIFYESGRDISDSYYQNDKLIFFYLKEIRYSRAFS